MSKWQHLPAEFASLEGLEAYLIEVGHYEARQRLESYYRRCCERYTKWLESSHEKGEEE